MQLVVFSLGREEYCLPIATVQEIIRYSEPRTMPNTDPRVRGVINLRGTVIPVCDLGLVLGLVDGIDGADRKIVIVDSPAGTAGLIVDDVDEVITVPDDDLVEPPVQRGDAIRRIAKVGDRLLVLLDEDSLVASLGMSGVDLSRADDEAAAPLAA